MAFPGPAFPRLVNSSDSDPDPDDKKYPGDDKKFPMALRKNSNSSADSEDSEDEGFWKRKV